MQTDDRRSDSAKGPAPGFSPAGLLRVRNCREIVALATPTILAMFAQTLMWTVDTIFLGHVSSLALAAAGLGGIIAWASYSLFNNLSRISSTFVSQAHGRGDDEAVGDYTWQTIYIAIAAGIILTYIGWHSDVAMPWTRNPIDVQHQAHLYIRWRTVSAVFTQVGFTLMGFFQGRRQVRVPMWAGIIANSLNVVLDAWLIFGWSGIEIGGVRLFAVPAMGIVGAAVATSIATVINTAILALVMVVPAEHRRRFRIHLPRRPDFPRIGHLVRIGLPSALEGFMEMGSFSIFTILIGMAGAESLAASHITVQLLSFSFMPMWGLTVAGSVLIGNWVGAGDHDRAAHYGRQVYKLGAYYCIAIAAIFLLLQENLYRVFTPDPGVLTFAAGLVPMAALFQFGDGLRMVGNGLLAGAGDTRPSMIISSVIGWGLFIPLTWLLVVHNDGSVIQAWTAGACCYILQSILLGLRFRSGLWRRVRIFRDGKGNGGAPVDPAAA